MPRSWLNAAAATVVLAFALPPVSAWAPETRVRMADEAVRLMPASLRKALESHRLDLLRGALDPLLEEDSAVHRPPWHDGTLDASIAVEAAALEKALAQRTPFADLARRFGRLAHFAMDAGFPPGVGDGAAYYAHFAAFCESRRHKFPLVFYGHVSTALDAGDYAAFAAEMLARSRGDDRNLARAYKAAGDPPNPAAFDDRSVPFAVASLSYSHTVTDVAQLWLAVWSAAGGDVGRTPYRKPQQRSAADDESATGAGDP